MRCGVAKTGCDVAKLLYVVAQLGCGAAKTRCDVAKLLCVVAELRCGVAEWSVVFLAHLLG